MLDNEAIYDICRRNLDIERPTYTNLNNYRLSYLFIDRLFEIWRSLKCWYYRILNQFGSLS